MINELSIIVPALNEEKYLPKLLNSILQQDFKGKTEVIIVDGNSEDRTIEVTERFKKKIPNFSILSLSKRGIGYQRNMGAKKAKYKYLLFIDADIILPKHFLNRFLRRINVREQFVGTANVWVAEKDDFLSQFVFACLYPSFLYTFLRIK
jgi:glycosyltransferase involved in cell wall biosynthesis